MFKSSVEYEQGLTGAAARARGRPGERLRRITKSKLQTAQVLIQDKMVPLASICRAVGVSRDTLQRYLVPDGKIRQAEETPVSDKDLNQSDLFDG